MHTIQVCRALTQIKAPPNTVLLIKPDDMNTYAAYLFSRHSLGMDSLKARLMQGTNCVRFATLPTYWPCVIRCMQALRFISSFLRTDHLIPNFFLNTIDFIADELVSRLAVDKCHSDSNCDRCFSCDCDRCLSRGLKVLLEQVLSFPSDYNQWESIFQKPQLVVWWKSIIQKPQRILTHMKMDHDRHELRHCIVALGRRFLTSGTKPLEFIDFKEHPCGDQMFRGDAKLLAIYTASSIAQDIEKDRINLEADEEKEKTDTQHAVERVESHLANDGKHAYDKDDGDDLLSESDLLLSSQRLNVSGDECPDDFKQETFRVLQVWHGQRHVPCCVTLFGWFVDFDC